MDAGFFDVFHDPGNVDLFAITDRVNVHFDGVAQVAVDQHGSVTGDLHGFRHVAAQAFGIVDDLHASATQNVRWAQQDRVADVFSDAFNFFRRPAQAVGGLEQANIVQQLLEPFPVFRQINGIGRCTENRNPCLFQSRSNFQRRLPAELHDDAFERAAFLFLARD